MKNLFLSITIVFSLFFQSCDEDRYHYYGTEETSNKIEKFISSNIKNANNMSDEEMEEVIMELYSTGVKMFCVYKRESEKLPNEKPFLWYR